MEKLLTTPATTPDIGELLSSELAQDNRHCFMKVLIGLQFLARQGIGIRGHDENESNLYQLLRLLNENDAKVCSLIHKINYITDRLNVCLCDLTFTLSQGQQWMEKKSERYIHHECQNELLKIMANTVLRKIAGDIQNSDFSSIMLDDVIVCLYTL